MYTLHLRKYTYLQKRTGLGNRRREHSQAVCVNMYRCTELLVRLGHCTSCGACMCVCVFVFTNFKFAVYVAHAKTLVAITLGLWAGALKKEETNAVPVAKVLIVHKLSTCSISMVLTI